MLLLLDSYQWARTLTTCNKNSNEVVREDTTHWVRPLIRACKDLRAKNYDTNPQKTKTGDQNSGDRNVRGPKR